MLSNNFVFGYGSLIERASRTRTTPDAVSAFPAIVQGVERGWWAYGSPIGFSTCFLGASMNPNAESNGVIYAVTEDELKALDRREAMYNRIEIPKGQITLLTDTESSNVDGTVWVYATPIEQAGQEPKPNTQFPIVQSYVDICLNGCLELEEQYPKAKEAKFAEFFIKTTSDWSRFWVNDRLYPRRPFISVPRCFVIDRLLHELLPDLFSQIQLEPARWQEE
jgi:cation transport regulator ChaC